MVVTCLGFPFTTTERASISACCHGYLFGVNLTSMVSMVITSYIPLVDTKKDLSPKHCVVPLLYTGEA